MQSVFRNNLNENGTLRMRWQFSVLEYLLIHLNMQIAVNCNFKYYSISLEVKLECLMSSYITKYQNKQHSKQGVIYVLKEIAIRNRIEMLESSMNDCLSLIQMLFLIADTKSLLFVREAACLVHSVPKGRNNRSLYVFAYVLLSSIMHCLKSLLYILFYWISSIELNEF